MRPDAPRVFIFEGPDYSGKSSTLQNVAIRLEEDYPGKIRIYRSPGGTTLGEHLRDYARVESKEIHETTLLFLTAIRSVFNQVIKDLEDGCIVLLDRWTHSTIAYQLSQLDPTEKCQYNPIIEALEGFGHVLFLFKISPETYQKRVQESNKNDTADRFETDAPEYRASVFNAYRKIENSYMHLAVDSDKFTIPQMSVMVYADILKAIK